MLSFARSWIDVPFKAFKKTRIINRVVDEVSFSYVISRNPSHRDSGVENFTFDDTFFQFLCDSYV